MMKTALGFAQTHTGQATPCKAVGSLRPVTLHKVLTIL